MIGFNLISPFLTRRFARGGTRSKFVKRNHGRILGAYFIRSGFSPSARPERGSCDS